MKRKLFSMAFLLLLALGWAGAAAADPADEAGAKATPVGLDDLTAQAQVICWGKHIGAGRILTSDVLKGEAPGSFTIPSSQAAFLPVREEILLFVADRRTWSLLPNATFVARKTKEFGQVIRGDLGVAGLLGNLEDPVRLSLHNLPAGPAFKGKGVVPLSLGSLVEEVAGRGPAPLNVRLDEFSAILRGVLKVQGILREGRSVPDLVNRPELTADSRLSRQVDFTPRQIRPPRAARKMARQFCGGTPVVWLGTGPYPGDDDDALVNFTAFRFPFDGATYDHLYINTNGYVTFGASFHPVWLFIGNVYTLFNQAPPAIAPLWADLDPSSGGTVTYNEVSADEFVVCWENVPSWDNGLLDSNSFTVHLYSNGDYLFEYDWVDDLNGVMAVTPGGAAQTIPGDWDFSLEGGHRLGTGREQRWYDTYINDLAYVDYTSFTFAGNPSGAAPIDPYESNDNRSHAYRVPDQGGFSDFATLDGCELHPADTDWFEINLPAGSCLLHASAWSWNLLDVNVVDTVLGVFDADGNLVWYNDDSNFSTDSELTLSLPGGQYFVAVSSYPDTAFNGSHAHSGSYGLNIQYYESMGVPLPLADDDFIPVKQPFRFQFVNPWDTIFVGSNGNLTMLAGSTNPYPSQDALEEGPPRIAPWWDDLNPETAPSPQGVYVFATTDALIVYWYGVPDYFGTQLVNILALLNDDGSFTLLDPLTTDYGLTGYGLGLGYASGGPMDLARELRDHSVPDEMAGGAPIIGTGWELDMDQTFLEGEPVTVPEVLTYMGCYPYEFMTYDLENDTYLYLRSPDRFRVMSRSRKSGYYLSGMYDPVCFYHPGDNRIHFTVGAVMEDFHARGWVQMDRPWGYGAAVGHNHHVPWTCLGY